MEDLLSRDQTFELIARSSNYGNLGLFIGAGLSMAVLNTPQKKTALSWKELIDSCAAELSVDISECSRVGMSYPEIATAVCRQYAVQKGLSYDESTRALKETVANLTSWYPQASRRKEYQYYFDCLNPGWVITTNYDLVIEGILTGKGYALDPSDHLVAPEGSIPVYHLHGIRTNPASIIITQEDYLALFRPNQYRQQKLPLIIKESVTLLIGYGLGDFNVLTAMDWAENVLTADRQNYPHDVIQLYHSTNPQQKPYRDRNNVLVVEFCELGPLLRDLCAGIEVARNRHKQGMDQLETFNRFLKNPTEETSIRFIDDECFRKEILGMLADNNNPLLSGFLELFSKSIDITWQRAQSKGAFSSYRDNLTMLLDILNSIPIETMPPALLESVVYNLSRVTYFVGPSAGQSFEAFAVWEKRKKRLPGATVRELLNIARARKYHRLGGLIEQTN
ncbi:MAG TPA: SIR2 family protein [Puia sp.]|nr:SIR2 family protein [Puia sp.]